MSESEAQIEHILDQFLDDIEYVKESLQPLLKSASIDSLAEAEPSEKVATPYTLSAYALSSLLFAYLRSEGSDVNKVLPLLGQVKDVITAKQTTQSPKSAQGQQPATESSKVTKSSVVKKSSKAANSSDTGKHKRF